MNKRPLLIEVAVIALIIVIFILISFVKSTPKNQGANVSTSQNTKEVTQEDLDKSITTAIESLKATCADFLKGDLSGDPNFDCPGFDKPINKGLCFYCYATKNQKPDLCGKIDNNPSLILLCQKATGIPTDNSEKK